MFLSRCLTIYSLKHKIDGIGLKKYLKIQDKITTKRSEKLLSQYVKLLSCVSTLNGSLQKVLEGIGWKISISYVFQEHPLEYLHDHFPRSLED